jgi:peptidyl-prolyl cis-trans isomerase C
VELNDTLSDLNLSEQALRAGIERTLTVRRFVESRHAARINPSDKEIREYFEGNPKVFNVAERIRISHVLVKIDPRWQLERKEPARKRMEEIRQRLAKGEDFAAVAAEASDCPSAKKGGDLGWFGRGQLSRPLEEVVYTLADGALSKIVEDRFGYHLIRVTGRKPARSVAFPEAKVKIAGYLRQVKAAGAAKELARELRGKGRVDVLPIEAE